MAVRSGVMTGVTVEGVVLEWGRVSKSISATSAGPQTSDAVFRIKDVDRKWRDLSLTQTFRGRTVRLRFSPADDDMFSTLPFWTGEIKETSYGPGWVQITALDNSWSWMDEYVPPLLTAANFPYLISSSEGAFAAIIFGEVNHNSIDGSPVSADAYGAIKLVHMGPASGADRYCVARHRIYDITVYRRAGSDTVFSAVDPGEYTVVVESLVVDGYTYEMSFVDFNADQANAVVTANIQGLYFRPAVPGYSAEGYDPVLNPTGVPGELHNPIDAFLNFMRLDCRKALSFNYDDIMAIRTAMTAAAYDCSGAITESETRRATLSKFLPNFVLDMFHNRAGEITLSFVPSPVAAPLYSDSSADGARHLILRESFIENDPNPIANRCVLPAFRHYAAGTWLWTGVYENFSDQAIAGIPERDSSDVPTGDRDPRIDSITAEFWFSRDSGTIYDVISKRMGFMSLKSYQQQYDLPTPEVIDEVELCKVVVLTHRLGLASGGYSRVETKVFGVDFDLRGFRTTLSTVRRIPSVVLGTLVIINGSALFSAESDMIVTPPDYEFVTSASARSSDTHSAATSEIDTTGADLLVAAVADYQVNGSIVTDNYGNTWLKDPPTLYQDATSELEQCQLWYAKNAICGPHHVFYATEATPTLGSQPSIAVAAFRFSNTSAPFDTENGNSHDVPALTTIAPGSITPSEDRCLVITAMASDTAISTPGIDGGFTIIEHQSQVPEAYGISLAYLIQDSAAAANPTWDSGLGSAGGLTAVIASFKAN